MFSLCRLLYPVLYTLLMVAYLPLYFYRVIFGGKAWTPLLERAGKLPSTLQHLPPATGRRLWIHAVSVGEVNVIKALVPLLSKLSSQLFISTTTATGQALAKSLFGDQATVFYCPLDWKWVIRRYLKVIAPDAVLFTETELWPGFIQAAHSRGVPLVLVNGRISDRSFRRYRRIRVFIRPLLQRFRLLCVRTRQDKERIIALGAPSDRVHQLGNIKYDYQLAEDPAKADLVQRVGRLLKPSEDHLLWVCGSTREGEEERLLPIFMQLRSDIPQLRLLLAPRHPHRCDALVKRVRSSGLTTLKRSQLSAPAGSRSEGAKARPALATPDVLILDSIGELASLYQLADVVFIGGSLIPWGGQNVIEAAHFGKPILFGPHMQNFREVARSFVQAYAAIQVESATQLAERVHHLLRDPHTRKWLGRNARTVVRANQGAVQRTVEILGQCLPEVET
ncbi:MAG: 3-deoxy-D-manno-octulosonic acid transferase [Acidobacteriota bacterium]